MMNSDEAKRRGIGCCLGALWPGLAISLGLWAVMVGIGALVYHFGLAFWLG